MINGHLASRKDAASVPVKKVRGAAALLVLDTIKALKERGVTDYDLCGAPPSDRAKDETHPLYGVGQFKTGFNKEITDYVGTSRVLGIAMIVAVADVLLITAIATLGAFLYNLSAALLGGIEVTLAEDN